MSELQFETSEPEVQQSEASAAEVVSAEGQEVINSESAPETPAEDNSNVNKRINQITLEKYTAIRENDALKKRLAELEAGKESNTQEPVKQSFAPPVLPDDIYDEEQMRKYHADMTTFATESAVESARSVYEQQQESLRESKAAESRAQLINNYAEGGLRGGLTIEQMQLNEQVIVGSGLNADVGEFIMGDESGAAIADHLANNPEVLHKINTMSPMQAASYITSQVKVNLAAPKTVTSAPDPIMPISGGGVREQDEFDRLCPGASFDSN